MNGQTMHDICTQVRILNEKFLGVVRLDELITVRKQRGNTLFADKNKKSRFFIVNIANSHWIALLWSDADRVLVFDSLGITNKETLTENIVFVFGIQKIKFLYAKTNYIQNIDSLTCGEHCIYFVLYETTFYKDNKHFDEEYIKRLKRFCRKNYTSTDYFVWSEIYDRMKLARVPNLHELIHWKIK